LVAAGAHAAKKPTMHKTLNILLSKDLVLIFSSEICEYVVRNSLHIAKRV
jgi:hypothetical protein